MIKFIFKSKLNIKTIFFFIVFFCFSKNLIFSQNCNLNFNINNPKLKNIIIKSNGIDRSFLVYTPQNYNPNKKNKIVFMFHGTSQDGMKILKNTAWNLKADQENFLVICPNSLCYYLVDEAETKSRWNDGNLRFNTKPHTFIADDVQFFQDILTWTESYNKSFNNNNTISNPSKIYVCGFSNGAIFCSKLLREASDKITAAGLVSSALPLISVNLNPNNIVHPIPTIIIYGTNDQRILDTLHIKQNQFPAKPNDFQANTFFKSIIDWHLNRNKLSTTFSQLANNKKYKLIYNSPKNGNSDVRKYFEIQVYRGLQHKYPLGNTTPTNLNATDIFNEFFNKY